MIVVADTGPINYLIWIRHVAVLPRLYTTVLIPEAVQDELRKPGAPEFVRRWLEAPPGWIEIRKPMLAPENPNHHKHGRFQSRDDPTGDRNSPASE
jgi:predicted nucleic acid-binding protein